MTERTVLVTGIGRCLADGLKARGYRVFATARRPDDVAALAAAGFESLALNLDSSDSIHAAVDRLLARTGSRPYAVINNAGYSQPGAVEDLSRAVLRAQFETNLFGTHELTARLIPIFRAQNGGRIVRIGSVLGLVSLAYRGAYNASKFALEALSDTLRLELRGTGIYVSLIEPGPVATRFRDNSYAVYRVHIDPTTSTHDEPYAALERRLRAGDARPLPRAAGSGVAQSTARARVAPPTRALPGDRADACACLPPPGPAGPGAGAGSRGGRRQRAPLSARRTVRSVRVIRTDLPAVGTGKPANKGLEGATYADPGFSTSGSGGSRRGAHGARGGACRCGAHRHALGFPYCGASSSRHLRARRGVPSARRPSAVRAPPA